ncbi:Protein AdrA [Saliniradius amylolyticus]|uniref:diguanylate cyclase n=1 Tax=Saliniradius amylolyticus TaxID=2183582 RepID=A0A2S2E1U7_9ALTE|nr:GGDEF domain-containing protein [Saliniradius amylolyticus]AWL11492.1 Protein AdrA [Saliniradius amylolyticus]
MSEWQLVFFDLLVAGLFTLVLIGFTHVMPKPSHPVKRRSTRYVRLFLVVAFATYVSTTIQLFTDTPLSFIVHGFLFLLSVYLLYFALQMRFGIPVKSQNWRWLVGHLIVFTSIQLCLIFIINSATLRGVNIALQATIPIALSAATVIQNQRNTGDKLLLLAFLSGVLAIFAITAFHQWVFGGDALALIKLSQVSFITLVLTAFCGFVLSIMYSLIARIRKDMLTDPLTKVKNRHYLDDPDFGCWLEKPASPTHTLVLCDIDHFKRFNDNHGHAVGDKVLIFFTEIVQQNCRKKDIFIRLGGEEFLLLLPNTDKDQAFSITERIRQDIAARPFVLNNGNEARLSCSFGLTAYDSTKSLDANIKQADVALYDAKAKGRNRTCQN